MEDFIFLGLNLALIIFFHCSYIFSEVLNDLNNDDSYSFNYIHLMDLHNNKIGSNNFINKRFNFQKLDTNSNNLLNLLIKN